MKDSQSFEKKFLILQEISGVFAATNNINALANIMIERAINYTNAEKGSVMLLNEKKELHIIAARGFDIQFIEKYKTKIGEGIAGVVALDRSPVLVENIDNDRRFKGAGRDRYKTKSFISCPLVCKDKVLGVININDKKDGGPFTADEFNLLKIIADQSAITIENAFLMGQLKTKASELEEINKKLIETDMDKTEFITRISHELRSPLNSIKGATYYLQQSENLGKNRSKEFFDIISSETAGLITIVENLLDFLRLENEVMVVKKSLANLADILKEVSGSKGISNAVAKKNLQLKLDINQGEYETVVDKIKVVQLFINLLEGLSYYLQNGDSIKITANRNDVIKIDISISRKLPEEVLMFLYKSKYVFYADWPTEKIRLSLAKKVAEAHGWSFEARNMDDAFLVCLTVPVGAKEKMDTVVNIAMDMFVEFISELLDLNICSIMLCNDMTSELTIKGARGLSDEIVKRTRINFGDQISGCVAVEGRPLLIKDIEQDPNFKKRSIPQYNTRSLLSLPLKIGDKVIGVLNLNNKKTATTFNEKDFDIASVFGERISHFLERLYSGGYKEDDINHILLSFDDLLDAVKRYEKKKRLTPDLMSKIMEKLRASEEDRRNALYVSVIYDLGLMLIDENILKKKELLPSEIQDLKIHPYTTIGLLNILEFSEDIKKGILHHHEKYDGSGYPEGLKGTEIPFISRVLSVVDSYCAMLAERPYGKHLSREEALSEIKAGAGSAYDPGIVRAFEEVLREDVQ
jgi:HD-GYP domain-containing protein (c-di-GMP phosphodiesterase class II)